MRGVSSVGTLFAGASEPLAEPLGYRRRVRFLEKLADSGKEVAQQEDGIPENARTEPHEAPRF